MSKLSYKKLFKKLIDIEMKNTELMEKAKVSKSTFYKIKNGENVTTDDFGNCRVLSIEDGGKTSV